MAEHLAAPGHGRRLVIAGGMLIGMALAGATVLSPALAAGLPALQQPAVLFVSILSAAGVLYAAAARIYSRMADAVPMRTVILGFAVVLRLTMASGTPLLEDDHYRYLWDGALTARGHDPYRYAPADIGPSESELAPSLADLAVQAGPIKDRINYPQLRTIYPPGAQAAFALAHYLSPWQMWAWRLVLSVFDLTALGLLFRWNVPAAALLIYGWNPLLIKEVYNSGHMDGLLLPFLLVAAVAAQREKPLTATAALGAAAGIKLWPVLLMPIVWVRLKNKPRILIASLGISAICLAATLLPMVLAGLDRTSGLTAYSRLWEMNDALYLLIAAGVDAASALLHLPPGWSTWMPRLAAAFAVLAWVFWVARRRGLPVGKQFLMATAGLLLLSPTQFPWYYLWLLPFLALHPHPALILYAALLPLYYLRPLMAAHGRTDFFDHGLVWIQHGPVLIWLARDWIFQEGRV